MSGNPYINEELVSRLRGNPYVNEELAKQTEISMGMKVRALEKRAGGFGAARFRLGNFSSVAVEDFKVF